MCSPCARPLTAWPRFATVLAFVRSPGGFSKEILAHELQHLIHFGRQVLANGLPASPENAYMQEGLAALAQDVLGYQAGNLYVTWAGLQQLNDFSLGDVVVSRGRYAPARDGALRGGAYLFARWLYDRAGGDEAQPDGVVANSGGPAMIRTLTEAYRTVGENLPVLTGKPLGDFALDFYTTLALSNREATGDAAAAANPCFRYLPIVDDPLTGRQRGADLYTTFHGQQMNGPAVQAAADADGQLLAGGVEILQLEADAEGTASVTFTVDVDPAAKARLRVARVRQQRAREPRRRSQPGQTQLQPGSERDKRRCSRRQPQQLGPA